MAGKAGRDIEDRLRILEKAVTNLADVRVRREERAGEDIADILRELKALKLFLTRNIPAFKEQFPAILQKVK